MMNTIFFAYFLVTFYFVMERLQRKSKQALSLQAGLSDRGSSRLLYVFMTVNIASLLLGGHLLRLMPWLEGGKIEIF